MFSWYKYLIVSLVFSHLGFWSGNLFLIAPFPDLCLLVPFDTCKLVTDKLIALMLLIVSFPSCLLAISITKTHKFIIIGCSPSGRQSTHMFQLILFRTASEILFTDIKLYCRQGPNIQKMLMIESSSRLKRF